MRSSSSSAFACTTERSFVTMSPWLAMLSFESSNRYTRTRSCAGRMLSSNVCRGLSGVMFVINLLHNHFNARSNQLQEMLLDVGEERFNVLLIAERLAHPCDCGEAHALNLFFRRSQLLDTH